MGNSVEDVRVDPVTVELIRCSLERVVEEMGITLQHVAHSPIFSQCKDFSVALFNDDAQLLAMAEYIPLHQGGMQTALEAILREIPKEQMRPGDVFMMNDPYRGGLHPQDLTMVAPLYFGDDELVGFAGCVAHRIDMGGMSPGSYCPKAVEIIQEAIRFPPIKLMERWEMRDDILRLFLTNVRLPEAQKGDTQAQCACLRWGQREVERLIHRYGLTTFRLASKAILDMTEQRVRAEVEKMPDGVFSATCSLDHDGHTDRVYEIRVAVTIKGGEAIVDYTGTDEQAIGFINSPFSLTKAAAYTAFMFFLDPSIPKNHGFARPVRVSAPLGTMLNPRYPAPVSGSTTEAGARAREVVIRALSLAMPQRGIGTWRTGPAIVYLYGRDPATDEQFICCPLDGMASGGGARNHADGYGPSSPSSSNILIPNVEEIEQYYPIRYVRREIMPDTGGAGTYRGSGGLETEYEVLVPVKVTVVSNSRTPPPPGIFGGGSGAPTMLWAVHRGEQVVLPQKVVEYPLEAGDRLMLRVAGGGGYGEPGRRDRQQVLADVKLGFVSRSAAKEQYGVDVLAS